MHKLAAAAAAVIFTFALHAGAVLAQPTNDVTGRWRVTTSGDTFASSSLRIEQAGGGVSGSYGPNGRIDGTFKPGTLQVDGNWSDARGTGWMTIVFTGDGEHFSGEWGYPGRKPSGTFVAMRLPPAFPALRGHYYVSVSGGQEFPAARRMVVHELGQSVVGNFGPYTELHGTLAQDPGNLVETFTGSWKGPVGQGWLRLQFTPDSKSFHGDWGVNGDSQARGQIVGDSMLQRAFQHRAPAPVQSAQVWVHGLWSTASSSSAFPVGKLTFRQDGRTVFGMYKGGHLEGTLPPGSSVLTARWRGNRGTGNIVLTFALDGKTFQGTWTEHGDRSGSIIGSRIIAASPALR